MLTASVRVALAVCLAVALAPLTGRGQEATSVEGEVVDLSCYLPKGSRGAAHKSCAQLCARRGLPLGVLTDGGDLFLLLEDHDNPEAYERAKKSAGERVAVTGKQVARDGMKGIVVGSVAGR